MSTDSTGQKAGEQGHYPFGEAWYAASTTTRFLFTSYQRDAESGNDYALARFYINRFARFCSVDPIQGRPNDPQSWNRYAYARNDPVNITDPSGQFWLFNVFKFIFKAIGKLFGFDFLKRTTLPKIGTPPTFPTGPGTDLQLLLFGPRKLSDFIISESGGFGFAPANDLPNLGECTKSYFGVELIKFLRTTEESYGVFEGTRWGVSWLTGGPKAVEFKVVNDPFRYSGADLGEIYRRQTDPNHRGSVDGLTLESNPYRNYTANELTNPDWLIRIQLHELAHSWLFITDMNENVTIRGNEGTARAFVDCALKGPQQKT